jgi:hypothetical protein
VLRIRDGQIVYMRDYFAGEVLEVAFDAGPRVKVRSENESRTRRR